MCHYDEVVRSVAGNAAGRLTARRSWFQSARYRGRRGRRSCRERRRGPVRPRDRQGDDRAGLTVGIDPAAYWEHGPVHRDNPRRDSRHMACRHGCGRDRGYPQDVCHHRTDRDGRIRRRVARGQAPSSRLARRSRRGHPMRAAARRYPAGPQTPGNRPGSLPGSRLPGGDHGPGMSMATRDTHPAVMADSGSLLPGLALAPVSLLSRQPACRLQGGRPGRRARPCAALLDLFAVAHAERAGSRCGDTGWHRRRASHRSRRSSLPTMRAGGGDGMV